MGRVEESRVQERSPDMWIFHLLAQVYLIGQSKAAIVSLNVIGYMLYECKHLLKCLDGCFGVRPVSSHLTTLRLDLSEHAWDNNNNQLKHISVQSSDTLNHSIA